jgi:hypothetical protein
LRIPTSSNPFCQYNALFRTPLMGLMTLLPAKGGHGFRLCSFGKFFARADIAGDDTGISIHYMAERRIPCRRLTEI